MTTNSYAAKRAIFDRMRERSHLPGNALSDALVSYSDPGRLGQGHTVYGGGIVFDQPEEDEAVEEADGDTADDEDLTEEEDEEEEEEEEG